MRWLATLALLTLPHCGTITPPPTNLPSAPKLEQAVSANASRVSASLEAAEEANKHNPEGPAKDATAGAIATGRSYAGPATEADRLYMLKLVNLALTGKLGDAQKGWEESKRDAEVSKAKIVGLEKQIEVEKATARAEMERQLKAAQDEANKLHKKIIALVFFGLGGLGIAGGVVCLVLAPQNPALGPRAGFAGILGGGALIATGIAVNAVENLLEAHPWVVWTGTGIALTAAVVASVLVYSNHLNHAVDERKS